MTEQNTTPDTQDTGALKPDLDAFNLEEWLATGNAGRSRETVTIYRDPSLLEEARKVAKEINQLQAQDTGEPDPDATMGDADPLLELQQRHDELEEKVRASKAEVEVTALSDAEHEEIEETFKQRYPGEKRKYTETVKGTALVLAQAATINGKKLTADQWRQLAEGPLAGGQWAQLKQAYLVAQNKTPRVDSPFSRNGSRPRTEV
ncbi:hypothetical protein ACFP47_10140 [Nesterenkonia lacusekhoensis]|uniref:Ribonuclease I n=1 Tax=Nesterenkonia lacusekhoensis TaxID=150832 RepID=A0ABS4T528_9MICC|nr:hypothetical protein [Nesterenkonia lacusekhoensis]MBP2319560.1 ribonuclease I [Nesterenkonia lacusekhoensis]